jgi:hypothetical protein
MAAAAVAAAVSTASSASASAKLPLIDLGKDDSELRSLLQHLYSALPEDIRIKGVEVDAADVLMEAIEYIDLLKAGRAKEAATPQSVPGQIVLASKHATLPPVFLPKTPLPPPKLPPPIVPRQAAPITVQPRFPTSVTPTRTSTSATSFVRNETNKMQTICLPPGGKVVNLPGMGQTIRLPSQQQTGQQQRPVVPTSKAQATISPVVIQLPPGAKIPIRPSHNASTPSSAASAAAATLFPKLPATTAPAAGTSLLRRKVTTPVVSLGTVHGLTMSPSPPLEAVPSKGLKIASFASQSPSAATIEVVESGRDEYVGEDGKEIWEEAGHGLKCIPRCSCPLNNVS